MCTPPRDRPRRSRRQGRDQRRQARRHRRAARRDGWQRQGHQPEQLFAAGYAACFHSALKLVARKTRQDADGSTVTAEVGIGPINGGAGYGLEVELEVSLPGVDRAVAEELVAKAHEVCPYSNATRGNIKVDLTVV